MYCLKCRYDLGGQLGEPIICPECGNLWTRAKLVGAGAAESRVAELERQVRLIRQRVMAGLYCLPISLTFPGFYAQAAAIACGLSMLVMAGFLGTRQLRRLFPLWSERRIAVGCVLLESLGDLLFLVLFDITYISRLCLGGFTLLQWGIVLSGFAVICGCFGAYNELRLRPVRDRWFAELRRRLGACV